MARSILAVSAGFAVFAVGAFGMDFLLIAATATPEQRAALRQGKFPPVQDWMFWTAYAYRWVFAMLGGCTTAWLARTRSYGPSLVAAALILIFEGIGTSDHYNHVPTWWLAVVYPLVGVALYIGILLGRRGVAAHPRTGAESSP